MTRLIILSTAFLAIFCQIAQSAPLKKAILLAPGAFVSPDAYTELIIEVQNQLQDDVTVETVDFFGRFPTTSALLSSLEKLHSSIEEQGFQPDITILAHSQGGIAASKLDSNLAARIIFMASYMRSDLLQKTPQLAIPTLTLGGSRDRLTLPTRIALDAYKQQTSSLSKHFLIPGINHFQFADGRARLADGVSNLSLQSAHEKIAKFITAFIKGELGELKADPDMIYSNQLLKAYFKAFAADVKICEKNQFHHLGLDESTNLVKVRVTRYEKQTHYPRFILDKSSIDAEKEVAVIQAFQYEERPPSPLDLRYLKNLTPEVIACKLRSAAAVNQAIGADLAAQSCLDMNLKVLRDAAQALPDQEKQRLSARIDLDFSGTVLIGEEENQANGFGFQVLERKWDRGDQWALTSFFNLRAQDQRLAIKTDSVTTPLGNQSNPFFGAHYCKVVPPSKALRALLNF